MTPKRTFAAVQPTTKRRVDLGLRLADPTPAGRLVPAAGMGSSVVTVRIGLAAVDEVDDEIADVPRRASVDLGHSHSSRW